MLKSPIKKPSESTLEDGMTVLDSVFDRDSVAEAEVHSDLHADRVPFSGHQQNGGSMLSACVRSWSGSEGILTDGSVAELAVSCLVCPQDEDVVLVWLPDANKESNKVLILAVLARPNADTGTVIRSSGSFSIEAPSVSIMAGDVNISSENMLTNCKNHHLVEDVRTETTRLRVASVQTDIRKAGTVKDSIEGLFSQKIGMWFSWTAKEAKLRARTFLFD